MSDDIKKGLLGIVVDDAIIVGENIYRHIENGEDLKTAARNGAYEVGIPVIFAVLTTAPTPVTTAQPNSAASTMGTSSSMTIIESSHATIYSA